MKLSKAQKKTLDKMEVGVDYTAYDLQCSLATLKALGDKEVIGITYMGIGNFYSPRTDIQWQKFDDEEE